MNRWVLSAISALFLLLLPSLAFPQDDITTKPPLQAHPGTLHSHVAALTSIDPPRWYMRPESMEQAVRYIQNVLNLHKGRIEVQEFEVEGKIYKNIIASYGPDAGPRIVVGAHYDVCNQQPGADDNASGVAGLLELARMLSESARLTKRVDIVAYALEEPPFFGTEHMGSAVHARSLKASGVEVEGMISLEMIGYFTDEEGAQRYPSILLRPFYPDIGDFIAVVGNFSSRKLKNKIKKSMLHVPGLKVSTLTAPAFITAAGFSDHRNFWKHGYQAVMVTDTSFYRNPHYHQPTDTPDTLDYERMAPVVDGVYRAVMSLAGEHGDNVDSGN